MKSKRTISFDELPPVQIDQEFIKGLGKIIEENIDSVHDSIKYTIKIPTETLEFESAETIEMFGPLADIKSFAVRISHYCTQKDSSVDVSIHIPSEQLFSTNKISSSDSAKLLLYKEKILRHFENSKTPWSFLHFKFFDFTLLGFFSFISAISLTYLASKYFSPLFGSFNLKDFFPYFVVIELIVFWTFIHGWVFRLFPRDSFIFSKKSNLTLYRGIAVTLVSGIIGNAAYSLILKLVF